MYFRKILILSLLLISNTVFAKLQILDKIIAIVDNDIILESDINQMIPIVQLQAKQFKNNIPDYYISRHQIFEKNIMDSIILQIGKKQGIKINNVETDQALQNIINYHNINIDELHKVLNNNEILYDKYLNYIKNEILINKVYHKEINNLIKINPTEINSLAKEIALQEYMQNAEINISYILFPFTNQLSNQQIKQKLTKANQIINELKKGTKFHYLASKNNFKNIKIVNMGWAKIEDLPTIFACKVKYATKGDVIGPVQAGSGIYVLKINDLYDNTEKKIVSEINIRHIMLKISHIKKNFQIKTKLTKLANKIINKYSSFEEIAKKYSEDFTSATQGGNLGWVSSEMFNSIDIAYILNLKNGEISKPIRSSAGWHLIQLIDKRLVDKTSEKYKERAYNILYNQKFNDILFLWQNKKRSSAYLNILDSN